MDKTSVLITTEGTYPCYGGGVSVWCDYLIRQLAEVDFHLFALTHTPSQPMRFELPDNVVSCRLHSIWGTEEPGLEEDNFPRAYERKTRTTPDRIRAGFLPHFEEAVVAIFEPDGNPERLGNALLGMFRFCLDHDYALAAASPEVWEVFAKAAARSDLGMSLDDTVNCLRWTQRNLSVVATDYPDVDIVHSSIAAIAAIPGVIHKLAKGSAFLLTEHGVHLRELYMGLSRCPYSTPSRAFLARFHRAVTHMNYHFADRISTLGEYNRKWQIRLGADPRKISIVPNGVDPDEFYPRPSVPRGRPTVLTMARIMPIKGVDSLIHAAARVRDRLPDVLFRVLGEVGDPSYFRECQRLVEEFQLASNVEFGITKESRSAYKDADVCCIPSRSEGMPFVAIEAMLSGCPLVASDVGSVAEMLGGFGVLVQPNHPEELADALIGSLTASEHSRQRQAHEARARALRMFTISNFAHGYRTIYGDLTYETSGLYRAAIG